jgi:hypothetical protein
MTLWKHPRPTVEDPIWDFGLMLTLNMPAEHQEFPMWWKAQPERYEALVRRREELGISVVDFTDSRFMVEETQLDKNADTFEELLEHAGLDDTSDLETCLGDLLDRPVVITDVSDPDEEADVFQVLLRGFNVALGTEFEFPLSLLELARACAMTSGTLAQWEEDMFDEDDEVPDIDSLNDDELAAALERSLEHAKTVQWDELEDL